MSQASVLALGCSIFTYTPAFRKQSPRLKAVRVALFGGFTLSGFIPIVHSIVRWGWDAQDHRISLGYILGLMAFNTAGAVAYALRVGLSCNSNILMLRTSSFLKSIFLGHLTSSGVATKSCMSWCCVLL